MYMIDSMFACVWFIDWLMQLIMWFDCAFIYLLHLMNCSANEFDVEIDVYLFEQFGVCELNVWYYLFEDGDLWLINLMLFIYLID